MHPSLSKFFKTLMISCHLMSISVCVCFPVSFPRTAIILGTARTRGHPVVSSEPKALSGTEEVSNMCLLIQ